MTDTDSSNNRNATCADRIGGELARREQQFAPWVDPENAPYDAVTAEASDQGFEVASRNEDEDDEDYVSRVEQDARAFMRDTSDERLDEQLLAVDVTVSVELRIELSTGGPGDFITADMPMTDGVPDGTIDNAVYHYQDWWDGATSTLDADSPLYALAERYAAMHEGVPLRNFGS